MMVDKIIDIFFLFEDVRFKLEELEIEFVEGKVIIKLVFIVYIVVCFKLNILMCVFV